MYRPIRDLPYVYGTLAQALLRTISWQPNWDSQRCHSRRSKHGLDSCRQSQRRHQNGRRNREHRKAVKAQQRHMELQGG